MVNSWRSRFGRRTTEFDFGFSIWTTVLNFGLGSRSTLFNSGFKIFRTSLMTTKGFGGYSIMCELSRVITKQVDFQDI